MRLTMNPAFGGTPAAGLGRVSGTPDKKAVPTEPWSDDARIIAEEKMVWAIGLSSRVDVVLVQAGSICPDVASSGHRWIQ